MSLAPIDAGSVKVVSVLPLLPVWFVVQERIFQRIEQRPELEANPDFQKTGVGSEAI